MSIYNKVTNSVADAVSKIMNEKLHPNQQKLDVHEPEKDELTADDFKKLRAGKKAPEVKKEEVEELDELSKDTLKSYRVKSIGRDARIEKKGYEAANKDGGAGSDRADQLFNKADLVTAARKRAQEKMRKEEVEELDELSKSTLGSYVNKASDSAAKNAAGSVGMANTSLRAKNPRVKAAAEKYSNEDEATKQKRLSGIGKAVKKLTKEAAEQIEEYTSVGGKYVHRQKEVKDAEAGVTDWDKEEKMAKDADKPAAKKRAYGAHQNRRTNTKLYKEMIESLKTGGIKSLFKTIEEGKIEEEASQEEFTKEMEDQKAKFDGKKKTADVAKPAVQAVQNEATHTEIQVIDMTDGSQKPVINIVDLEEKSLTEPEMKKKEEVVKSMKKGIAGFKERYGDRAKSVMYATATNVAKDKA